MWPAVVVLLVAVGVSDGVILSKCKVKQQLEEVLTLPPNTTDIVAKIVCHVQHTSNFSTSAINTIPEPKDSTDSHSSEEKTSSRSEGKPKGQPSKIKATIPTKKPKEKSEVWTMYGLFQLSDHVACSSTHSHSPNLCRLNCDKLLDDDITDDLACVKVLMAKMTGTSDHETVEKIKEMFSLFEPQCVNAGYSYFSDCL